MSTAIARVFGTTELIEHIILFVPPSCIINLLRVCKSLRQLVHDSPAIRRVRILDPTPIGSHGVDESIFYSVFPPLKINRSFLEKPDEDESEGNPVNFECQVDETTENDAVPRTRIEFEWKCLYQRDEKYWSDIAGKQLFNPPIKRASFGISSPELKGKRRGDFVKVWKDSDEAGITVRTMKRLFDECLQMYPKVKAESATCSVVVEVVGRREYGT